MKKLLGSLTAVSMTLGLATAAIAGTIRVENSDSKSYTIELKCSGSGKTLTIDPSKTTSYTFDSMATSCDIVGGNLKFPTKKLEDGQKWKIHDGEAKAN